MRPLWCGLANSRPVNENAQESPAPSAQELNLDNLDSFRLTHALGDFHDLCDNLFLGNDRHRTF